MWRCSMSLTLHTDISQIPVLNRPSYPNGQLDSTDNGLRRRESHRLSRSIVPILPLRPQEQRFVPFQRTIKLWPHSNHQLLARSRASATPHQRRRHTEPLNSLQDRSEQLAWNRHLGLRNRKTFPGKKRGSMNAARWSPRVSCLDLLVRNTSHPITRVSRERIGTVVPQQPSTAYSLANAMTASALAFYFGIIIKGSAQERCNTIIEEGRIDAEGSGKSDVQQT